LLASGKIVDRIKSIQQAITSVQANDFHVFFNILPTQFGLSITLACGLGDLGSDQMPLT